MYFILIFTGDTWIPQRVVSDVEEFGDISHDENGWNRVLVDEVDILHAVEQGSRIINRSECRLTYMHQGMLLYLSLVSVEMTKDDTLLFWTVFEKNMNLKI